MSIWHEGIYGNDDAQEFLDILLEIAEESDDLFEVIKTAHEHTYSEFIACRFFLADLEADFVGDIMNYSDVLQALAWEQEEDQLKRWQNRDQRVAILQGFKQSLDERISQFYAWDEKTWDSFFQWIDQKKQGYRFESVAC